MGPFVDVGTADDSNTIVHDANLTVNIDLQPSLSTHPIPKYDGIAHQFTSKNVPTKLRPVPQRKHSEVVVRLRHKTKSVFCVPYTARKNRVATHIDPLLPQPRKDRVRAPTDRPILALQNNPHRARLAMIHRHREPRQQRDHNTTLPRRSLPMRSDDPMHDRVSDLILDRHVADHRRSDEELVLDVDEVFGHLDGCANRHTWSI